MTRYLTPPPNTTDDTERAAEPTRHPRRFTDQRGIALQTVIIMVVMLAIAGAIAAVLLSRGNQAAEQLDRQEIAEVDYTTISSFSLCESYGGEPWDDPDPSKGAAAADQAAMKGCKPPS